MSTEQTMAIDPASLRWRDRLAARVSVTAARVLARRPPKSIARTLTLLSRGARPATYREASHARTAVTNTSWVCTGPKGCLPRSIATALLCRLHGSWPTWCVGARVVPPFGAHAWVVAGGIDVDEPYPAGYHRVLVRVGPRP